MMSEQKKTQQEDSIKYLCRKCDKENKVDVTKEYWVGSMCKKCEVSPGKANDPKENKLELIQIPAGNVVPPIEYVYSGFNQLIWIDPQHKNLDREWGAGAD